MKLNLSNKMLVMAIVIVVLLSVGLSNGSSFGEIDSPKKQIKKGIIQEDVICKPGNVLVIRTSDKPACLKPTAVLKLKERGQIKSVVHEFTQSKTLADSNKDTKFQNNQYAESVSIKGNTGKSYIPSQINAIPALAGAIINFYITDDDLNTSRDGIDVIPTNGLLEFTINKIPIEGPKSMIETGPNTGQFYVKLQLPDKIKDKPLNQGDIVEMRYLDHSDSGGEQRINIKSITLGKTYAHVQTSNADKTLIGHDFVVRVYEPDANLDSKDVDRIPLNKMEYRGEGGIRTTLANPAFDANGSFLRETGENTGIFEIIVKIPRTIDGNTVQIGDWYEISYVDTSTPSDTNEKIKLRGKIE
jgi:hypothetical protein